MPVPSDPSLRLVALHDRGRAARVEQGPLALAFRPIAELEAGAVVIYEALVGAAADPEGLRETPAAWSQESHPAQAGRIEARLVRHALVALPSLPDGADLLLKVSSYALLSEELGAAFDVVGDLRRVVVSLSDDADPAETPAVGRALDRLRSAGARFAVDDAGGGQASLRQLVRLRPELVRIGETFTAEVDRDPARAAVVEALVAVASRMDAQVIGSEVPGVPELHALMRLGVPLAQGPVFGDAPEPGMGGLGREARAVIAAGRVPRSSGRTVAEAVERLEPLEDGMSANDIAERFLADPRFDSLVSIDLAGRPVALLDRAALLRGEPYDSVPMTVSPDGLLTEVARRATSRPTTDRLRPLVACDQDGRYLGIVRIERLLEALASPAGGGERPRTGERRRGPGDRRN